MPSGNGGGSHDKDPASSGGARGLIDIAVMAGIVNPRTVTGGGEASGPSHARSSTPTASKGTGRHLSATASDVPQLSTQSPVAENGVPPEKGGRESVPSPSQLPNAQESFAADCRGSESGEQTSTRAPTGVRESSVEVVDSDDTPQSDSPSMVAAPNSTPENHSRQRRDSRHWTLQMKLLLLREGEPVIACKHLSCLDNFRTFEHRGLKQPCAIHWSPKYVLLAWKED